MLIQSLKRGHLLGLHDSLQPGVTLELWTSAKYLEGLKEIFFFPTMISFKQPLKPLITEPKGEMKYVYNKPLSHGKENTIPHKHRFQDQIVDPL